MGKLERNTVYTIELCNGERRRWRCLAQNSDSEQVWWRDEESGTEFTEASLMYAWQILGKDELQQATNGGKGAS